jgi:transposase InsO family protein
MKRSLCTNIARSRRRQPRLQTFLEEVYNAKRLHSSLDYVPPDEFEVAYLRC